MKNTVININCDNYNPEIALWKAVILQAFVDLQSNSKKKIMQGYKIKAMLWFNLNNKDFIEVCRNANLDPIYVWTKAKKIIDSSFFLKKIS